MKFSQVMTCIRKSDSAMNKTINDEEVLNSILEFPTIVTVRNILRIFFFSFSFFLYRSQIRIELSKEKK